MMRYLLILLEVFLSSFVWFVSRSPFTPFTAPVDSLRANSPEFRACRCANSGNLGGAQHTKLHLNLSAILRPH